MKINTQDNEWDVENIVSSFVIDQTILFVLLVLFTLVNLRIYNPFK